MLGLCLAGIACASLLASQAMVLVPGASRVIMYRGMKRVIVVDPTIADVVVASRAELILFAKATGQTKLYVWDAGGRHEYAVLVRGKPSVDALVTRLRDFMPAYATVRVLDEKSVLLEGVAPSGRDHAKVVETASKIAGDIKVVDLMQVEGEEISPAEHAAAQLRRLLGPSYEYIVWGDATVLVKGPMDDDTMAQVQKLSDAMGGGVKIVALKSAGGAGSAPTEEIAQALGKEYRVWTLGGNTVVVEGTAVDEASLARVKALLQVFEKRAQIVNLVTIAQAPKPTAGMIAQMLRESLTTKTISVRTLDESTVVIDGSVPTDEALKGIDTIVAAIGKDVKVLNLVKVVVPEKRRVIFRVRVLDVDRDRGRQYGFDWGTLSQTTTGSTTTTTFQDQPILIQAQSLQGHLNLFPFGAQVNALETDNRTKVLAQPNLVVNDGEEANMLVGGEIPIPIAQPGSSGFSTVTVEYKPFGVTLKIKPTITADGNILAKVLTEVSTIDFSSGITIAGLVIPGLKTRKADTLVTVAPGSTLVIGGLYREDESKLITAIPLISRVPIIGEFFKRRQVTRTKTELVILITPEVMAEANPGAPQ
jgi:pilus assembly protein CpaC